MVDFARSDGKKNAILDIRQLNTVNWLLLKFVMHENL